MVENDRQFLLGVRFLNLRLARLTALLRVYFFMRKVEFKAGNILRTLTIFLDCEGCFSFIDVENI